MTNSNEHIVSEQDRTAIAALGYEAARDELVAVVQRLEAGSLPLEESLALWERGELLATRCQEWLDGARERLNAVVNPPEQDQQEDQAP
ncbi:exodeoxyribonuclease VII small subunit [Populibacterium corticicola]|jgi:exodeoxyribonuclease VII small subunit|uniref:Exodeoxyribonuclease 7 small subunit n=1 Tax=Populibacterium corticicola TaxID=1812826 RepID=A0ABW5XFY1_9MICO